MARVYDGVDDYETYVQDGVSGFAFGVPATLFLRYKFTTTISNSGEDQPLFSVSAPTALPTNAPAMMIGKNAANQFIGKSARSGDSVNWVGFNTVASGVVAANVWHAVVVEFTAAGQTIWVNGNTSVFQAWNRNDQLIGMAWAGIGGVYLYGDSAVNVKPNIASNGVFYGGGLMCDVGALSGTLEASDLTNYLTGGYSCPKMYESFGGAWKYILMNTYPGGFVEPSMLPAGCFGQTVSYSNFASTSGTQTNGPTVNTDWPTLIYPARDSVAHLINRPMPPVQLPFGRQYGI